MTASLVVIAICATGCAASNTSIEQSWTPPSGAPADLHKVVTVMVSKDTTVRRTAEDDMAHRLHAAGVEAVPAYQVLSDQDYADREAAKAKLKALGFDGVVAMRIVSRSEQLQYVPTYFSGYWGAAWPATYATGYLESETVVRVETTAYSLRNDKLVYSALSRTIDPNTVNSLLTNVTATVAKALEQQGVVVASPAPRPQAQPPQPSAG